MTTTDTAEQFEKNLKFSLDQANETITAQKTLITDLTSRLQKVTDIVDQINKAQYRGTIKKYADPKKVTNIELEAMDVDELSQMADILKLIKKPVAGVDYDVEEARSNLFTIGNRFKFGAKPDE